MMTTACIKRITNKIGYFIFLALFVLSLSSCNKNKNDYLNTPTNIQMTDDCYLVWDEVEGATEYEVVVNNVIEGQSIFTTKTNKFDALQILSNTEEFRFKVCAKDSTNKYQESDDSIEFIYKLNPQLEYFDFTFDSSGCYYTMSLINKTSDFVKRIEGVFVIPSSYNGFPVKCLDTGCFDLCKNITCIYMPDSIEELGKINIFYGCTNLKRIRLSNNIEEFCKSMFSNCESLAEIDIPDSIKNISQKAFYNCDSLSSINIGKNVLSILDCNFSSCDKLSEIMIDEENPKYCIKDGCLVDKDNNSIVSVVPLGFKKIPNDVQAIEKYAFYDCDTLDYIEIPSNINEIGQYAFQDCSKIKKVVINANINEINIGVFRGLSSLEELTIPPNILKLDGDSFGQCENLKSITIPDTLKSIGGGAFFACNSIEELFIPSTLSGIGLDAFAECSSLKKVVFDEGIEELDGWISNCENLEEITIPSTVKTIKTDFFKGLSGLKRFNIPDTNTLFSVDSDCIIENSSKKILFVLESPKIPDYIEIIGERSFSCSGIESIHIPSNIKCIESYAFSGQKQLKSLTFDEGLETISTASFYGCDGLESVSLPKSLKTIGEGAFSFCKSVFILYDTFESIGNDAFFLGSVYTNSSCFDVADKKPGFGNRSFVLYDCDIEDGYVKSYHNYRTQVVNDNVYTTYLSLRDILIRAPYREGYKFLGFSYDEEAKDVDIPVQHYTGKIYYYLQILYIDVDWDISLSLKLFQTLEDDTILYTVWEKIEE